MDVLAIQDTEYQIYLEGDSLKFWSQNFKAGSKTIENFQAVK